MGIFRAGELLGIDAQSTMRKLSIGEDDPAALEHLMLRAKQAGIELPGDGVDTGDAPVAAMPPPPPRALSNADVVAQTNTPAEQLSEMEDSVAEQMFKTFLQMEAAHYGTSVPEVNFSGGSSSSGSGSGGA